MDQRVSNPETSPSLLLRLRNPEDRDSWKTFERIYGAIIRSYCRHWKLQPVDIDDVTQDVLAAVVGSIQRFEYDPAKGRFRGWLGTITANKIKHFLAKKNKRRELEEAKQRDVQHDSKEQYGDPDSHWVELFSERILAEACRTVRPEFEENTWRCFESTWIHDMAPAEVAQSLEIAVHAVYVNKSRVLKRLEAEIRDIAEDLAYGS